MRRASLRRVPTSPERTRRALPGRRRSGAHPGCPTGPAVSRAESGPPPTWSPYIPPGPAPRKGRRPFVAEIPPSAVTNPPAAADFLGLEIGDDAVGERRQRRRG